MIHFYCFPSNKTILISDQPLALIKKKYGHRFEILTSIRDKESIEPVKVRLLRNYPSFIIIENFKKVKAPVTEEARQKMRMAKLGKPRDEVTKAKISNTMKGKSNFEGKRHTDTTKSVMAEKKIGNTFVRNTKWVHDPKGEKERRVKSRGDVPEGYSLGRDYYMVEIIKYNFQNKFKSR